MEITIYEPPSDYYFASYPLVKYLIESKGKSGEQDKNLYGFDRGEAIQAVL
jgi:hypothetical protein